MSGADDQRAAERLRDAVVCHCYEIAGPVGGGHWASCLAEEIGDEVTAVLVDRDRLRAELAETRDRRDYLQGQLDIIYDAEYSRNDALKRRIEKMGTAGDALADEVERPTGTEPEVRALVEAWRSVRGDARTAPAADVRDPASETHRTSAAPAEDTVCVHPELDGPCSGCAPAIDPTIGEGIRLEDIRDRTARDHSTGEADR